MGTSFSNPSHLVSPHPLRLSPSYLNRSIYISCHSMSPCPVPARSDPILIYITRSSSSPHLSHLTHLPLFLLSRLRLPAQVQTNNQGSWGGKGTKKSRKNPKQKSKFLVQTAGIEPTKRKDFESSNVIISEKKDRKASVFQVKDLPYPYTSVEQYEARFKTPLGSEWNSRSVYQKENMPRVTKKVSRLSLSSFLLLLCDLNIPSWPIYCWFSSPGMS